MNDKNRAILNGLELKRSKDFFVALHNLCQEHKIQIVYDENRYGFILGPLSEQDEVIDGAGLHEYASLRGDV